MLVDKEESVRINNLSKRAETLCDKELWAEALVAYEQILHLAPNALFGVQGRNRAARRVELDRALEDTLARPKRLKDDAQLETARQLLNYAQQFSPQGVRIKDQVSRLENLIIRASTPVTVLLNSDDMTDIVIYHVGRLGTFLSKELTLKPGSYTVVGSRNGFHDVREIIDVNPENKTNQFFIQCREPI